MGIEDTLSQMQELSRELEQEANLQFGNDEVIDDKSLQSLIDVVSESEKDPNLVLIDDNFNEQAVIQSFRDERKLKVKHKRRIQKSPRL